ncbi:MAG: N-acetyltransferase [Oceanospirillales bacterium]|nr:N-acetyltransferase [Oceanospirillales bacterium]MBR9889848.1 N-acetyltransferase [Oceanospirillales bacterium]
MSFIHPLSDVGQCILGAGTRIWQYAVILDGAVLGDDCNVCAHTLIEGNVVIGDRVTIKSGVFLWDSTAIGNDVFIGPNATFTNDPYPRSKRYPEIFSGITVKDNVSIGANSTILPGLIIGEGAMVGAGAVVTKDVPPRAVVIGNPASIIRYIE